LEQNEPSFSVHFLDFNDRYSVNCQCPTPLQVEPDATLLQKISFGLYNSAKMELSAATIAIRSRENTERQATPWGMTERLPTIL
jgi:hypothetical protein